jgi:hypothetical protein
MPLLPTVLLAVLSGLAAALAARAELRGSPRPVVQTRGFAAYMSYAVLVLTPATLYFYLFHGDWFLLYWIDVARVPSAVALVGFLCEIALGGLGFLLGASLVRGQREVTAGALLALLSVTVLVVLYVYRERLGQVGTYAQYHAPRQFGLEPMAQGPLLRGVVAMGSIVFAGGAFLLARLWYAGRRRV